MRSHPLAALLATALLACAGSDVGAPPAEPLAIAGRVVRVDVAFDAAEAGRLAPGEVARTAGLVRQSARDWLEQSGRLAPEGDLAVSVTLDSLRLRGALATGWFAWAVAPDHLSARVVVRRRGAPEADFRVRVESALAGSSWRARDARLDRLARRLGRRVAGRLDDGL